MKARVVAVGLLSLVLLLGQTLSAQGHPGNMLVNFTERFRLVTWDNAITLDDAANAARTFTRHRTQFGVTWSPTPEIALCVQAANEFRYYTVPANSDFHLDEVFFDQLYLKLTKPWQQPLTITIGRQNIMLGEGFIVWDGGPLDGSRSAYFNAVHLDWRVGSNYQLIAFVSHNQAEDRWLPIVHDQHRQLIEQPETGAGVSLWKSSSGWISAAYIVFKKRESTTAMPVSASTAALGGSVNRALVKTNSHNLNFQAELALQLGRQNGLDRVAFGGDGRFNYSPTLGEGCRFVPQTISAGVIYLSGDNPNTERLEDWDPMFARWPKWSESYIYTLVQEHGVAWWSNLISLNLATRFSLAGNVTLNAQYHHLMAAREVADGAVFPGGKGKTRGDLFIGKLSFGIDESWSGHLLWEGFSPGSFYFDGADGYNWIRMELLYKFRRIF